LSALERVMQTQKTVMKMAGERLAPPGHHWMQIWAAEISTGIVIAHEYQ